MTKDSAIRTDLHSAEVVHFTHTIQILIVWASSPHSNLCHDKHSIRAFCSSTLVQGPTLRSIYLPAHPRSLPPCSSVTPLPRWETHSVFRTGSLLANLATLLPTLLQQSGFWGIAYPYIVVRCPVLK
jgi:hypothetical protein